MTTQRKERDLKHALNPEPGDYWDEMLVGVCVVLEVTDTHVVICKSKRIVDSDHWTWDLSKKTYLSRQEFKKWLEYDTMPNNFWASVNPRHHIWAVKEHNKGDNMTDINNRLPVKMEFSIASITEGIEYWLKNVVLKEDLVVDKVIFDAHEKSFIVTLARGIQVGAKL